MLSHLVVDPRPVHRNETEKRKKTRKFEKRIFREKQQLQKRIVSFRQTNANVSQKKEIHETDFQMSIKQTKEKYAINTVYNYKENKTKWNWLKAYIQKFIESIIDHLNTFDGDASYTVVAKFFLANNSIVIDIHHFETRFNKSFHCLQKNRNFMFVCLFSSIVIWHI